MSDDDTTRPYRLDEVTVRIVDTAAEVRAMFGDAADEIAGRTMAEHEYAFEVTGRIFRRGEGRNDEEVRKTVCHLPFDHPVTAARAFAAVNANYPGDQS
jgi:hypothetical protein